MVLWLTAGDMMFTGRNDNPCVNVNGHVVALVWPNQWIKKKPYKAYELSCAQQQENSTHAYTQTRTSIGCSDIPVEL